MPVLFTQYYGNFPGGSSLLYTPVMLKTVFLSYILKSDFFEYMLTPCILYNCVSIYRGHPQNIKGVLQR